MIRDLLLGIHATAWVFVMVITAWRTGSVPAELWAALPLGVGAIMGAFRANQMIRPKGGDHDGVEDQ